MDQVHVAVRAAGKPLAIFRFALRAEHDAESLQLVRVNCTEASFRPSVRAYFAHLSALPRWLCFGDFADDFARAALMG